MLQITPSERPGCKDLLETVEKLKPNLEDDNFEDEFIDYENPGFENPMLATINLPRDLKLLDRKLPRSNYASKNRTYKNQAPARERSAMAAAQSKSIGSPIPPISNEEQKYPVPPPNEESALPPLLNPHYRQNYHDRMMEREKAIEKVNRSANYDPPSKPQAKVYTPVAGAMQKGNQQNLGMERELTLAEKLRRINQEYNRLEQLKYEQRGEERKMPQQEPQSNVNYLPMFKVRKPKQDYEERKRTDEQKMDKYKARRPEWWG